MIHLLGLSFKTSPVEIREKLAIRESQLSEVLWETLSWGAREAVLLSTCNRVEIYWAGGEEVRDKIRNAWELKAGRSLEKNLYFHRNGWAVLHLFRVASGLDSMVLGESQILGQVKTAYQNSLKNKTTGLVLNRLFQRALFAGKLVRTQTQIAGGITSVASAAVVLAERIFKDLNHCSVMILGAGKMAEAAAKHLSSKKVKAVFVSNRTYARARELALTLRAEALHWEEGMERMRETDIVLCSTACPTFVLTRNRIQDLMGLRRGRPLFLIDIAVPRDVEPSVQSLEGVYVYDIDHLNEVVAEQMERKKSEAEKAENLVLQLAEEMMNKQAKAPPPVWQTRYA
ncbi:MAG: glutamyl-tRNA reductase [Elusimicrobia bacterium]|nr:glutamyl-tRNA reductase [Elusimicrobiota bacterium]